MSLLSNYLDKNVAISHLGRGWMSGLCADIAEAARTRSYLETTGNKADTMHRYASYLDETMLKRSYELTVRDFLRKKNIKSVKLAIDGKKDLYFGKNGTLNARGIKHQDGTDLAWEYIVLSIVEPVNIPLMAVRYPQGADLTKCCIELLDYAKKLPIKIICIFFDRGFYIGQLIDYLENKKGGNPLPYLILVPQNQKIKRYVIKTQKKIGIFKHWFKYSKNKSTWKPDTTIVVCKDAGLTKEGKHYDMIFATNLKPSRTLIREYKKRWNIETGFRIMEEGKIMTKSNNSIIRLFYFLLRCVLCLIWRYSNHNNKYVKFKEFLRIIEYEIRGFWVEKPPPNQIIW